MSEGQGDIYTVDRLALVPAQIRSLAHLAQQQGKLASFIDIFKSALHRLEHDPLEWGDPTRRTALPGGLVCHAIINPLVFNYAVYETERVVMLLSALQDRIFPVMMWVDFARRRS